MESEWMVSSMLVALIRRCRPLAALTFAATAALMTPATMAHATDTPTASTPAAVASVRPVLRLGSHGAVVEVLQQRLAALRYDVGPVDGDFGSQTYHGVVAFQKVNGLGRDGIVGPLTWAALDSPVTPKPRRTLSAASLEVNLTKQVVYRAQNGVVLRIYDASTGKASTPTPVGNFTVNRRIDGWRQSSLGLLWRPNYFYGGYAVHGSTSVPAYPASHGCVRLTVKSMNRLWPLLRIGTPVSIYR